jgi:D-cysteine desulfhydrase
MDLGGLPTPVTSAEALAERLALPALLVKGDDRAGDVYGGSKARKLEVLLADALTRRASSVLTFGGVGSNHALATAVHARRMGLGCVLALLPERPSAHAREHLLAERGLGCEQVPVGASDDAAAARVVRQVGAPGSPPYIIPVGGTCPLGNLGYVNAAFELAEQCESGVISVPDVIFVAAGTLGTTAGLHVGLRAAGLPSRLVAVRASNPGTGSDENLRAEVARTASFLRRIDPSFPEPTLELLSVEHGFAGPGYAIPTPEGQRAAGLARDLGGLELDLTYTAKAFAGLIDHAPRLAGQRVLFWNTFDPRHVPAGGAVVEDLPPPFRRYFPGRP